MMLAGALAALLPTASLACGGFVSGAGGAEVDQFQALISHDGASEDVLVQVDYSGARAQGGLAWLLPLPSAPRIGAGDGQALYSARLFTTPPSPPHLFPGAAQAPSGAVRELGRTVVGDLEFVTLGATSANEVAGWMAANHFAFRDRQAPTLQRYLDRHWVLVAARLTSEHPPTAGRLAVRFTFPSPDPVYPLVIAGADHQGTLSLALFVLTAYRPHSDAYSETVIRPGTGGYFGEPVPDRLNLLYSAPLSAEQRAALSGSVAVPPGAWLTRYEGRITSASLTSDLVLGRSPSQARIDYRELQSEYDRSEAIALAVLVGVVLLLLAIPIALVAAAVVVAVHLVRRRRRGQPGV